MEFDFIAIVLLTVIVIAASISVISYIGLSVKATIPEQAKNVYDNFVSILLKKSPYNVCQSYDNQELSIQDFQIYLQAAYNGQCGNVHTHIIMSFSVSKDDLAKIATQSGIAANGVLIFYNLSLNQPLGIGAIIVKGNPGYYPLKTGDTIEVWSSGSPKPDLFINETQKGCDPYDDVCDPSCLFKNICDPVCDNGNKYNIPCNIACIDIDGDGIINATDAAARINAGKCNPDCYGNITNPQRAYDPGCVWKYKGQNDDICDPNSNGVSDGACDPDCVNSKNICDPDCNGNVSAGNPYGLYDKKCFVCDQTCNGYCSPACNKNALPGDPGFDSDCYKQINSTYWCSGDGICDTSKGENCANSIDCPGGGITCSDYNPTNACCPTATNSDQYGCSPTAGLTEGGACTCGTQCATGLQCDNTNHCCPDGKTWNGTACNFQYTFTVLFIQLNGNVPNLQSLADQGKNLWVSLTPLNACPGKVRDIAVTDKICNVPNQSGICSGSGTAYSDTMKDILDCVDSWGYKGIYTRVVGVLPTDRVCSVTGGYILGYTDIYATAAVSAKSDVLETSSHEMGHTFGLCDEGYGIAKCPECNTLPNGICSFGGLGCVSPNGQSTVTKQQCQQEGGYVCPEVPQYNSIHCTANPCNSPCTQGSGFSSSATAHLHAELDKYCK